MASIYKRANGNWIARVSYKENGEYRRINQGGFRTRKLAQTWATEVENRRNKGNVLTYSETFLPDFFNEWYQTFKSPKGLADNTVQIYTFTKHVLANSSLNMPLKEITFTDYQQFFNQLGKRYSVSSLRQVNTIIRACVRKALQMRQIPYNFTDDVEISGKASAPLSSKYLEVDDIKKLTDYCVANIQELTDVSKMAILFSLLTGARFAEVAGMTWDCVNFREKTITINKTIGMQSRTFEKTKNSSSIRTLSIDPTLLTMLQKWKLISDHHMLKVGFKNPMNLVFYTPFHRPLYNSMVNNDLKKICRKNLSREISFHGLRHSHASYLIAKGISVQYVSKRLGHKSIGTTQNVYIHFLKAAETKENEQAQKMLNEL
ncbi:site-specific integrase [Lentilactobacillus hilgardii]|uniref:site-specific integrase n=1 Tax=Lentilactobacillus hilgardii TaxID=1588 RepID=UPI0021C2A521|nr:site-specific integrase [Lentilactobacillus hilgardii]MCP9333718.1 site-specific integrase [Lentilactobacillus hilgardii]MCP9350297.1 site-specific integrase [Lentilactobacillus hilgardii]MCP9353173.1 site-specific integrase [Lentilactobacillus hilgardii]